MEALTAVAVGVKQLAFGALMVPLSLLGGGVYGAISGYSSARGNGNSRLMSLGIGLTKGFEQAVNSTTAAAVNAYNGATQRLLSMDNNDPTVTQSLRTLAGEIPLIGKFVTGGNRAIGSEAGRTFIAVNSGIHALDAEHDRTRSTDFLNAAKASGEAIGIPEGNTFLAEYGSGTILDVAFSLLNLSDGYAYTAVKQIMGRGVKAGDTMNMVAHSGGGRLC